MDDEHLKNRWAAAYKKARDLLAKQDLQQLQNRFSLAAHNRALCFSYCNTPCTITWPELIFTPEGLPAAEQILILHYLTSQPRASAGVKYVSYRQLPSGMFYDYAFRKNGPGRLLFTFGQDLSKLIPAARCIGGESAAYHDIAVKIPVLPGIEVIIIFQREDDEFPPEVNLLFRDDIVTYLSLEDISLLTGFIAGKLAAALKTCR